MEGFTSGEKGTEARQPPPIVEDLVKNMTEILEEITKISAHMLESLSDPKPKVDFSDQVKAMIRSFAIVGEQWQNNPEELGAMNGRYLDDMQRLFSGTFKRLMGEEVEPIIKARPDDRRFADEAWDSSPIFSFFKQSYLLSARWSEQIVANADVIDEGERRKARFYLEQVINMLSPSNFLPTNPELIRDTINERGANLSRGMKMLAEDIKAGNGAVKLRQTDYSKFQVGRNLAVTPGKVVFENRLIQLIQYEPTTKEVHKTPVLIVPPWINKFYILDLVPEKSFIRWLVDQGHTVFCISWVNPSAELASVSFADYMIEGPQKAMEVVQDITEESDVNLIGYCVGGTMVAALLAYYAAKGINSPVASATFFTTQVDFMDAGDLLVFIDEEQLKGLERAMLESGYLDSVKMYTVFNLLRANDLIWPYVVNNYVKGKAPFPFDLLYWNSDGTRMTPANHSYYLRACYKDNLLAKGEMVINGCKLDLKKVKTPVYSLATREDHIAPAKSVYNGVKLFGGPTTYVLSGSGHIAGVINPPSKNKYQFWVNKKLPKDLDAWLKSAQETKGSWWPHWEGWLKGFAGSKRAARKVSTKAYPPIEDAPGRYVVSG